MRDPKMKHLEEIAELMSIFIVTINHSGILQKLNYYHFCNATLHLTFREYLLRAM